MKNHKQINRRGHIKTAVSFKKTSRGSQIQENLGFMLQSHGFYGSLRDHKQINRRAHIKTTGLLKGKQKQ